jgi:hypothetical protein
VHRTTVPSSGGRSNGYNRERGGAALDARDGMSRMTPLAYLDWSAPASMPGYTAVTLWDRERAVATGQGPDRRTALHGLWMALADLGEDQHTLWSPASTSS